VARQEINLGELEVWLKRHPLECPFGKGSCAFYHCKNYPVLMAAKIAFAASGHPGIRTRAKKHQCNPGHDFDGDNFAF